MLPAEALHREVGADGLTRQERGMIDRELFPKRKHAKARRKYVRRIRQRSNTVVCDLIAEDGHTLTLPMAAALRHYNVGEQIGRGRARTHRLPARIAETLTELKLTTDIRRTILGAIIPPPSRRAALERRAIRANSAGLGPARETDEEEPRRRAGKVPACRLTANRRRGPDGPSRYTARDGEGRAEGDRGRGAQVPRRGFSK